MWQRLIAFCLLRLTSPADWGIVNVNMLNACVGQTESRMVVRCVNKVWACLSTK